MQRPSGWWGIAAFVAGYDAWAGLTEHRTLSAEFRESSRTHPLAVTLVSAYLLAHLYGIWPRQYDPLTRYCVAFTQLAATVVTPARDGLVLLDPLVGLEVLASE